MTTALVLSGGGSLGAVPVGMLQARGERGVEPDLLVRTSAGAINAALVGGHGMGAQVLDELAGLWRSLRREGRVLIDGGIAEHAAIRHALECGADEVYLLPTGFPCALAAAPTTAIGVALQALTLLTQQQLIGEVARYAGPAKLKVLPPLCPLKVSAADFSHADELIARAKKSTRLWLDEGGPDLPMPERFLSMHDHPSPQPSSHPRRGRRLPSWSSLLR